MNLKKTAFQIHCIYKNSRECYEIARYMHLPKTNQEKEYIRNSNFWNFTQQIFWRSAIIDLAKIIYYNEKRDSFKSSNHHYNLFEFIEKTKNYTTNKISDKTFEAWKQTFNKNKKLILNITLLRDKLYAHTDNTKFEFDSLQIKYEDIDKLFDFIRAVIKCVYDVVLENGLDDELDIFDKNFSLFQNLVKSQELFLKNLIEKKH